MDTGTTSPPSKAATARPSRRALFALATGLLLAVVAAGWWAASSTSAGHVDVEWTPACVGTEVSRYERSPFGADEGLVGQYVIDSRPGFRCDISLTIHNSSRWSAHLTSITAPWAGPTAGGEFVAVTGGDSAALKPVDDGEIDATFRLDQELAAGDSLTLVIEIGWRESGCNSGDYLSAGHWPTVNFDLLGLGHRRSADQYFVLHTHDGDHQRRPRSSC